tara:strand:+ start:632 stop:733 length:102 start_codon:yes stop_codon:yes gene_type:complete
MCGCKKKITVVKEKVLSIKKIWDSTKKPPIKKL